MTNRSRTVTDISQSKHTSRLIKAGQMFGNLKDDMLKPEGLWGSKAKITISLNPYVITFDSAELDFEFEVPFDDNLEANEGEIIVYNLSDNTLNLLSKIVKESWKKGSSKEVLTIEAGYEGDTGVIYKGYITKVSTTRSGADRATTIKVIGDFNYDVCLELSYSENTNAQYILRDLLKMTGKPIEIFAPVRNYTYESSVTVDSSLAEAIKKYSEICGVSTFISKGNLYCCKLKEVNRKSVFEVSTANGMIGSPEPFTEEVVAENDTYTIEGYEIEMLLQHRVSAGSEVHLSSDQYYGTYYVKDGSHSFNESSCTTTIRVVK